MTIADYKHKLANLTRDQQELLGDFALLVVGGRGQDFMHKIKNCINTNTRPSSSPQPQSSNKPQQKASGTPQTKKSVTNSPNVSPKPPTVSPNSPKVSPKPSQTQPDKPKKSSNESKSKRSEKPKEKSKKSQYMDFIYYCQENEEAYQKYCEANGKDPFDGTLRNQYMQAKWNYIKGQPKLLKKWHMPDDCPEEGRIAKRKLWEKRQRQLSTARKRAKEKEAQRKATEIEDP